MNTTGVSGKRRGRPPLPIELLTYVAGRLNAGESMKDIARDSFTVIGIASPKPGTLEYEVSQEVAGRNIAARYREMRKQVMAPCEEAGHTVPMFMGRPLKMPASVTETVERKRGRPRKKPPVT